MGGQGMQIRWEVNRRIARKEEEFENICGSHARALDPIKTNIELEQAAKAEAPRVRKTLEGDINRAENALDHFNVVDEEVQSTIKI